MSKEENYSQIKSVINWNEGLELHDKHGGSFRFPIYMTEAWRSSGIDNLDLGVRSYNSLKRAGYNTIGDVVTALHEGKNLKTIRNCGAKSVEEIMEKLFMMQYNALDDDEHEEYLKTIVKMNKGNSSISGL